MRVISSSTIHTPMPMWFPLQQHGTLAFNSPIVHVMKFVEIGIFINTSSEPHKLAKQEVF